MLQYSERVSVQQKCDFLFFFSVDDCVWVMTGRRGTVAQGTLGHCSTVGTAGTSSSASSCPVHGAVTAACGSYPFPIFLSSTPSSLSCWFTGTVLQRLSVALGAPGGSRVPCAPLWAVGSESCTVTQPGGVRTHFYQKRNQRCPIQVPPIWHNPGVYLGIPMKTDIDGNLIISN